METKYFQNIAVLLAVFVSLAVVSATGFSFTIVEDIPSTVTAGNSYGFKVNFNNSNTTFSSVDLVFSGSDFDLPANNSVISGADKDFTGMLNVPSPFSGTIQRTLTVDVFNGSTNLETLDVTFTATVPEQTLCEEMGKTEGGDLRISDFDINNKGRGDDDEWDLLDEIEIDFTVENTHSSEDVDDVVVEIIIRDGSDDVTNDFDIEDEEIDFGKIRDDDEETDVFLIEEVPIDIDEGDYDIYLVAYSEDNDSQCVSVSNDFDNFGSDSNNYATIDVKKEHDEGIIIQDEDFENMVVTCGQNNIQLPLTLYNVGDKKEEKVLVNVYNNALDIDEQIIIDDFKDGKKKEVDFLFDIPSNVDEKLYFLDITTYYDWDEDEDDDDITSYDQNSEDDLDESYGLRLDVQGCGVSSGSGTGTSSTSDVEPVISAKLSSDIVEVGEEVVITATLSNPSNEDTSFAVTVGDYQDWASLEGVSPGIVSLDAGEEEEVTITLVPSESGVQTFELRLKNSAVDVVQDVSINVDSEGTSTLITGDSIFGGLLSDDGDSLNAVVVALIVLIVVLLIVIFIVAVRRG